MTDNPIRVRTMDPKAARSVKWAWKHRIVQGRFNLIIGNEGIGKGTLVAWILAKMTKGQLPGALWKTPVNVGIIGYEDSLEEVWTPRMGVVGANPKRVKSLDRTDLDQIDIRRDISELADVVQAQRIGVLYFDQFLDNLAADADHYHAKTVRAAIAPLATVAKELNITVIGTMHPNKRAENFRQLVQGSSAFNAIARSSMLVAQHPSEENKRVLVTAKSNYGQNGHELEFQIMGDAYRNGRVIQTSRVAGFKPSDVRIEELIAAAQGTRQKTNKEQIIARLREMLKDGEWHRTSEIVEELQAEGFARTTIHRAAAEDAVMKRKKGFQGEWEWKAYDGS